VPVLEDVSFTVQPGQLIALVGPSGAGKTTLISLMNRCYEPTTGRITIDGIDVRRYQLRSLREQIGVVLQEAILFSGTVADNIRYGRLDASDEAVTAAGRAASAEEFVCELHAGYATEMEKAGATLSGGQRQRLSIARAFLKDAPILLLDEPTASLDAISEQRVLEALKRLRAGRTTFVIAHRLSTVQDADCILVFDRARLVARGTHTTLTEDSPLYREMCAQLALAPVPNSAPTSSAQSETRFLRSPRRSAPAANMPKSRYRAG
jgi:ABC-type multidrug transport system fused ATPase/permease subunit